MALDFPATPGIGQIYAGPDGALWKWDGIKWIAVPGNLGSVQQINTGVGLTGGPIVVSGTISAVPATTSTLGSVIAGSGVTVNAGGTISVAPGGVTSITAGTGLSGGTITTTGTIANTGVLSVDTASGALLIGAGLQRASQTLSVKPATTLALGGIIAGSGISIDGTGLISVTGGGASITVQATAPAVVDKGLWWDSTGGQLYIGYNDGNSLAWVIASNPPSGSIPVASTTTPLMNGTAAIGVGTTWARNDHVHPVDTSRAAQTSLANYLPLVGGSMTGAINSTSTGNFSVVTAANQIYCGTSATAGSMSVQGPPGSTRQLVYYTTDASKPRWTIATNAEAEAGSNNGSNFTISAWSDAGGFITEALKINRVNGAVTASTSITAVSGYLTRQGMGGATANIFNISWVPAANLWIDTTNIGTFAFTSDYRTKRNVAELSSMWDRVKALRPISYQRKDYTPPNAAMTLFTADDIERWGFVAHELQETLIEDAATGVKDEDNLIQSPNPWTLLAAVTRALQEAMARIEALEGAA